MMKRNLAILSTAAILSLSFGAESFASVSSFTDLNQSVAKDSITALQQKGIIQGVSNRRFLPDETLTEGQGIQLIVNALGLSLESTSPDKPAANQYFNKIQNEAWYANALVIAQNNGFDLPADLDPAKSLTREEFTHQLMLAMEHHGDLPKINVVPVKFQDEDELTVEYQGTVQRALVLKIAKLNEDGTFHPQGKITRAEAAVLTYNALEYLEAHHSPDKTDK